MNSATNKSYFASCPRGIEEILLLELKDHNITESTLQNGGVKFNTTPELVINFIIQSRLATRIFEKIGELSISTEKDIYEAAQKIPWHFHFGFNQSFKIKTILDRSVSSLFNNSMIFSLKLKDSIADQFMNKYSKRPSVEKKFADISFLQRVSQLENGQIICEILLDLCGNSLGNRGYRRGDHEAPLKENLAAGIIKFSGWNPNEERFIDLMCGSGTFPIEAFMIKYNIPPSFLKIKRILLDKQIQFSFQNHQWFQKNKGLNHWFGELLRDLYFKNKSKLDISDPLIMGMDINLKNVKTTKIHLANLGIKSGPKIFCSDALSYIPENSDKGVILCNPPYGERIGEEIELEKLYYELGEALKHNFKNQRAYIFTCNADLRKKISLRTSKRIPLFNGPLEGRLLEYILF